MPKKNSDYYDEVYKIMKEKYPHLTRSMVVKIITKGTKNLVYAMICRLDYIFVNYSFHLRRSELLPKWRKKSDIKIKRKKYYPKKKKS